jgi:magnesium-transporting ATPase (P-type)
VGFSVSPALAAHCTLPIASIFNTSPPELVSSLDQHLSCTSFGKLWHLEINGNMACDGEVPFHRRERCQQSETFRSDTTQVRKFLRRLVRWLSDQLSLFIWHFLGDEHLERIRDIGSQTECVIIRFAGADVCEQYQQSADVVKPFGFDRIRKQMSTIEQISNGYAKGAPDDALPDCVQLLVMSHMNILPLSTTCLT